MIELIQTIVCVLIAILTFGYVYFKYKFSYWKKLGIPYIVPKIPFGNIEGIGRKTHSSQLMSGYYNEFKSKSNHPFGGIYFFTNPIALIVDLDLVKNILIKDFGNFMNRGLYYNERDDPLSTHLLTVEGNRWRTLRSKLTPTFTSGKMKFMYSTMVEVGNQFKETIDEIIKNDNVLEMRDLLGRFTTDIIGTCAFGIDCNSLKDPNARFREMGRKVFDVPKNIAIKQFFMIMFRKWARFFRMTTIHADVSEFFLNVVQQTIDYRKKNNIQRNDFMNLLMQMEDDGIGNGDKLSINEIAAQSFLFFLAGFETSSTAMTYALYELSLNLDIQEKAREEIRRVVAKLNGGVLTYDAMLELHYIDQILYEALRKYPPASNLIRQTSDNYNVPNTESVIAKDTTIWISVYGIHHDPEIYSDPDKFDPDRFLPENIKARHPCAFLGFGEGPRNCIGLRFGMMQARIGLVMMLLHFRFSPCSKSEVPLVFSPKHFILTPKGGLWLKIEKL